MGPLSCGSSSSLDFGMPLLPVPGWVFSSILYLAWGGGNVHILTDYYSTVLCYCLLPQDIPQRGAFCERCSSSLYLCCAACLAAYILALLCLTFLYHLGWR